MRERPGAYLLFSPESFRITTATQVVIAIEQQNTGELRIRLPFLALRQSGVALFWLSFVRGRLLLRLGAILISLISTCSTREKINMSTAPRQS
jgi:hypothetical protein